ncbi:hypothetical protein MMC30_002012 [Trapelia coarctata]|nr:hypothetical protein [Trapelia coarctata]
MPQQEPEIPFDGYPCSGPNPGSMEYMMNGGSSTDSGMADCWTGGQGLNEALQQALQPLSVPFDIPMEIGEEFNQNYGIQVSNAQSVMQETPVGPSNPHISISPSPVSTDLHEPSSSTPTTTATFTLTLPYPNAVILITTPRLLPGSPVPPAFPDLPLLQAEPFFLRSALYGDWRWLLAVHGFGSTTGTLGRCGFIGRYGVVICGI